MTLLKSIGLYTIFALIISYSWQFYELKVFGQITPDPFHTVVAMLLALSLMLNVVLFVKFKELLAS